MRFEYSIFNLNIQIVSDTKLHADAFCGVSLSKVRNGGPKRPKFDSWLEKFGFMSSLVRSKLRVALVLRHSCLHEMWA